MPNWCNNTLKVQGPANIIAEAKKTFALPYTPPGSANEISGHLLLWNLTLPYLNDQEKAEYEGDGDGWYELSVKNWGTKWEVDGAYLECPDDETLIYVFDTAWGPPLEAFTAGSVGWPDLVFSFDFDEPGADVAGRGVLKNGELVESEESQSRIAWCETCEDSSFIPWGEDYRCLHEEKVRTYGSPGKDAPRAEFVHFVGQPVAPDNVPRVGEALRVILRDYSVYDFSPIRSLVASNVSLHGREAFLSLLEGFGSVAGVDEASVLVAGLSDADADLLLASDGDVGRVVSWGLVGPAINP